MSGTEENKETANRADDKEEVTTVTPPRSHGGHAATKSSTATKTRKLAEPTYDEIRVVNMPAGLLEAPDDYDPGRVSAGLMVGAGGPADIRYADLTFAAGDVVAYLAKKGTAAPAGFEQLSATNWHCLGWLDTSGGVFALNHTTKDIGAAGTLSAIRTVVTGGTKTLQITALESLNPYVRALYDDVPVAALAPLSRVDAGCGTTSASATVTDTAAVAGDVGSTVTGTGVPANTTIIAVTPGTGFTMSANATATGSVSLTIQSSMSAYVLPEVPLDNQYALVLDSIDGDKLQRLFAPLAKVTARGNDQIQQADAQTLQMTFTFYPANITIGSQPAVRGELARYIGYGSEFSEVTGRFSM